MFDDMPLVYRYHVHVFDVCRMLICVVTVDICLIDICLHPAFRYGRTHGSVLTGEAVHRHLFNTAVVDGSVLRCARVGDHPLQFSCIISTSRESVACRKIDIMGKRYIDETWTAEWSMFTISVALYAVKCV